MSKQWNTTELSVHGEKLLSKAENILAKSVSSLLGKNVSSIIKSHPIKLANLEKYIKDTKKSNGFKTEFESLGKPTEQLCSWEYAQIPENLKKHRYPTAEDNLLCYDETRVKLFKDPKDPYSDFIMANWVDSYSDKKRYIATQGPMESTINDFYRMIWQYNVHEIIMLASSHDVEKGKCAVYFPEGKATYGEVEVELQRKIEYPDVLVRIYSMKRLGTIRVLVHHHFLSWPDMGVPKDPNQLLNLIKIYRNSDSYTRAWPVVVHCAGGVGRTGTFILADSMYDRAGEDDEVDFINHLFHIRHQRISLVETPEQYELAHRIVQTAYKEGLFGKN